MKLAGIEAFRLYPKVIKEAWVEDEYVWPSQPPSFLIKATAGDGSYGIGEITSQTWYLGETAPQIAAAVELYDAALRGQDPGNFALAHQLNQVTRHERAPADSREAVLATLAAMCGATTGGLPRPVTVKQDLAPLFTAFAEDTIPKIIDAAATSMRRARRGGSGLARPAGGVLNWMPRRRAS